MKKEDMNILNLFRRAKKVTPPSPPVTVYPYMDPKDDEFERTLEAAQPEVTFCAVDRHTENRPAEWGDPFSLLAEVEEANGVPLIDIDAHQ